MRRYRNFLALNNQEEADEEAARMKQRQDFTNPSIDLAAIQQAKQQGTPADAFLATNDVQQAEETAR